MIKKKIWGLLPRAPTKTWKAWLLYLLNEILPMALDAAKVQALVCEPPPPPHSQR